MADISKWLEMLIGPAAGAIGDRVRPPTAPAAPPAPAGPSITDPIAAPPPIDLLGTTPQDAPLPGLGGPPLPPDIAPNPAPDVAGAPPITTPGNPLNAALGLPPPDPSRVENTGSLVPPNVNVPVPDIPPIAPPPAVAQSLAERKAPAQRALQRPPGPQGGGSRPLSPVNVQGGAAQGRGSIMGRRTGPMGTPLHEGGFRSPLWSNRLSRQ